MTEDLHGPDSRFADANRAFHKSVWGDSPERPQRPPISDAGFAVIAAAASRFTPEDLVRYLVSKGWRFIDGEADYPDRRILGLLVDGEEVASVMVPLMRDYADFARRFVEAISTVARVEEWNVVLELPEGLR